MIEPIFQIRQCIRPTCRFRFPLAEEETPVFNCPKCGSPTRQVQLPYTNPRIAPPPVTGTKPVELEILLDNLRSTLNVGSIFRTSDGVGVRHIHICGITPTPDHPKIRKTALGAEELIPWTQHWNGVDAAQSLVEKGLELWALEGWSTSENLFEAIQTPIQKPVLLIVGNETAGVDPGILELCRHTVWIPMTGEKRSLNVSVAFGIAAYALRFLSTSSANPD